MGNRKIGYKEVVVKIQIYSVDFFKKQEVEFEGGFQWFYNLSNIIMLVKDYNLLKKVRIREFLLILINEWMNVQGKGIDFIGEC